MKKIVAVAAAAVLGMSLVACDSAAEEQAEAEVDTAEDVANERIETAEDAGVLTEGQADAAEETVEANAQAMEDSIDEVDPETPAAADAAMQVAQ